MYKPEVAFYLGEQKTDGYSGVVSQDNLFFCLEINSGISTEQGYEILDFVKERIKKTNITNLSSLDTFVINLIREKNLPSGFSMATGYLRDGVLYLKTAGAGKIFIRRKGKLGLLIEGNNTASGPVENGDFFIFITENFFDLVGGTLGLGKTFDHRNPHQIIDEITPSLKSKNDAGAVALFVNFIFAISSEVEESNPILEKSRSFNLLFHSLLEMISGRIKTLWFSMKTGKKTFTLITVLILFLVFIWSVVFGFQRRASGLANEKIKLTKELISQKLVSAEEVAFLNMGRALILIKESKEAVEKLKQETKNKKQEISELEKIIQETENKILKKEQRQYSEFYDLSVDDKNALGNKIYLNGEIVFILDKKRGVIYQLSMEKKSLVKNQFSEIKSADLIAGYEEESFFYVKDKGVYRIDDSSKLTKIIEKDSQWSEIKDIFLYNGNIYLLDKGRDEIWKYLRGENGYGSKSSYFQSGQAIDLSSINSIAIDGSVYLAGDSIIVKYTSGLRDGFRVDLPDSNISFAKVITSQDLEKIYLWDRKKGSVYVLGKTGDYVEQVSSEILSKGTDIVVYKDNIYVLSGSKIYKVD